MNTAQISHTHEDEDIFEKVFLKKRITQWIFSHGHMNHDIVGMLIS